MIFVIFTRTDLFSWFVERDLNSDWVKTLKSPCDENTNFLTHDVTQPHYFVSLFMF